MSDLKRWRGLKDLVRDAVEQGSAAVERVHLETARRPFAVIESISGLSAPTQGIRQVHDAVVSASYGAVRAVTQLVDKTLDAALDALDDGQAPEGGSDAPPPTDG